MVAAEFELREAQEESKDFQGAWNNDCICYFPHREPKCLTFILVRKFYFYTVPSHLLVATTSSLATTFSGFLCMLWLGTFSGKMSLK